MREFVIEEATVGSFWLRIVIVGGSGDGKSTSALELAKGIGGKVVVVDTDYGRASLNAKAYKYSVVRLDAPCNGDDYICAIKAAVAGGATTVILDTVSEEHETMLEEHAEHVQSLMHKWNTRDEGKVGMSAWKLAKDPRKRLRSYIRQAPCHMIICVRCSEKLNQETKKKELTVEGHAGFAKDALASFVIKPNSDGKVDFSPKGSLAGFAKLHGSVRACFKGFNGKLSASIGTSMVKAVGLLASEEQEVTPEEWGAMVKGHAMKFDECATEQDLHKYWVSIYNNIDQTTRDALTGPLRKRKEELTNDETKEREPGEEG